MITCHVNLFLPSFPSYLPPSPLPPSLSPSHSHYNSHLISLLPSPPSFPPSLPFYPPFFPSSPYSHPLLSSPSLSPSQGDIHICNSLIGKQLNQAHTPHNHRKHHNHIHNVKSKNEIRKSKFSVNENLLIGYNPLSLEENTKVNLKAQLLRMFFTVLSFNILVQEHLRFFYFFWPFVF